MVDPNTAFEDELYFQYLRDPYSVSPTWREYFEKANGKSVNPSAEENGNKSDDGQLSAKHIPLVSEEEEYKLLENEEAETLNNIATKIAMNMEQSIGVPTATSIRSMPVKALDENRRIINKYLIKNRRSKVSFTHFILWAMVKALQKFPNMNNSYAVIDGKPSKVVKSGINIGLAVDIEKKNGDRLLLVPNLKNAEQYYFSEFIQKFDDLIIRARNNKLTIDELSGTTATLTNPGMIGTTASIPRLMKNQGLIMATGAIDYPVEFQSVRSEVMTTLALSKVVTMTSTYDHRVIQGAESAQFLDYMNKLLIGSNRFYDQIFASLKIPFEPVRWEADVSIRKYGLDNTRTRVEKGAHVMQMINAYRVRGHLLASINPLGNDSYYYPELDPAYYGLTIWDLDREFPASTSWEQSSYPLREIIERIRETYCGSIGIEYMHMQDPQKKDWIKKRFENRQNAIEFTKDVQLEILHKLTDAEVFENFLHRKFVGHKRFSLEGSESVIVLLDKIFDDAADNSSHSIIMGMAHRGRLNVLVNNIGKKYINIFNEFDGDIDTNYYHGSGDVKYHLGQEGEHVSRKNQKIRVHLAPNPSHLEIINPVVLGMARAVKVEHGDKDFDKILPILVHGDAAFAGQGIVQEVLNMAHLKGYATGGTIHIIINNQIGFTTTAESGRSTTYATDVAKMTQCPIIHVNGNDPEAVLEAAKFAFDFRQKYNSDVIIDLLCYRKYGHNEGDEPSYTQPLLYKKIRKMEPIRKIYAEQLVEMGVIEMEEAISYEKAFINKLNEAFDSRKLERPSSKPIPDDKNGHTLSDFDTRISNQYIEDITETITTIPEGFNANPKVKIGLQQRRKMISADKPAIDWAMGEALAFGSLLKEGHKIRLSGEDSRRGTFSQRHAVLTDMINERDYIPLNSLKNMDAEIAIFDSPLSELAVLGFDYGFSVFQKETLIMWEAQFGDFANMAQPIVDQFISCGEVKWGQTSGLVMLLPHGHDGQGPEHSSARLERYLQLCADENMIVCNFTTPSNYFHALRRQMKFKFDTPLIIMTPKSMLRHAGALSSVSDFTDKEFLHNIDDINVKDKSKVKRILVCTGKVYYDLEAEIKKTQRNDIAAVRVEQIYPLHKEELKNIFASYKNAQDIAWVQEEPKNQGAWPFICQELMEITSLNINYAGRNASASTATGSAKIHAHQQNNLVDTALNGIF